MNTPMEIIPMDTPTPMENNDVDTHMENVPPNSEQHPNIGQQPISERQLILGQPISEPPPISVQQPISEQQSISEQQPIPEQQPNSEQQSNKRRRKKSPVWEHFTVETIDTDNIRACCNQCKKSFAYITGSKLAGTSHLKRHITLGICPVSRQRNQLNQLALGSINGDSGGATNTPNGDSGGATNTPKRRYRTTPVFASMPINQDRCNQEIANMIILHEYPLNIVEHPGFIGFVRTLQPQFNMASFNTIQDDCVAIYKREKASLLKVLRGIPGRVCITLDLWTSDQNLDYIFLKGHFIDSDWKLHRRLLNVVKVPSPASEDAFHQAVSTCLSEWGLESRLFTLTLDKSFSSVATTESLRSHLTTRNNQGILNGQLLIGNCFARVLTRLAQDALGMMRETVRKVRESVKYVKTSDGQEGKFMELKQHLLVPGENCLLIDDQTKWSTTYHMLVAACELQEVFNRLGDSYPEWKQFETPSEDEWKQLETLVTYLKLFFDSANILSSPTYPNPSIFPHEAFSILVELTKGAMSPDTFISNLTRPMYEKFEKYWYESSLVLGIAAVMDPRYKMKWIEWSFGKIYGEDAETWTNIIKSSLHELYLDYNPPTTMTFVDEPTLYVEVMNNGTGDFVPKIEMPDEQDQIVDVSNSYMEGGDVSKMEMPEIGPIYSTGDEFEVFISEVSCSTKSELDQYLDDALLGREEDIDVLNWWKVHKPMYPTLARMASDILSIPVSTVCSDSVFDMVVKKMDGYKTSLLPVTLEALVCAKDWLQYGSSKTEAGDNKHKTEHLGF